MHLIVRDIINSQLSLAIVIIRLFTTVARIYRDLLNNKHESRIQRSRKVNIRGLIAALNKIFNIAINKIAFKWEYAKEMVRPIIKRSETLFTFFYEYIITVRFSLLYRHKFLRTAREDYYLFIFFIHSRQQLDRPLYEPSGQKNKYFNVTIDLSEINTTAFIIFTQNEITRSALKMETFKKTLNGEK